MKLNFIRLLIVIVAASTIGVARAHAESQTTVKRPTLITSLDFTGAVDFCGEPVPLKNREVRERFEKELMLSLWDRPQVILWLKRSRRYLPIIEQQLIKEKMPDDLKYIAIAESALRPHSGSKKGAIGFWQFVPATGRKYGLTIDHYKDERRNIYASTKAALRYLKALYRIHDSWTLATAAYNMGEKGLMAEILEQGIPDYYQLYLPLETQRYLFRILSVKLILSDPEKYGFYLSESDYYSPLASDPIQIKCTQETPVRIIARASGTHFKVIKDLNPEIRGHYLKKGSHDIRIPEGSADGFKDRFRKLEKKYQAAKASKIYIVKEGDNLSLIADRYGIPLAAIIIWNRIDIRRPIHPGDRLIIYGNDKASDDRKD